MCVNQTANPTTQTAKKKLKDFVSQDKYPLWWRGEGTKVTNFSFLKKHRTFPAVQMLQETSAEPLLCLRSAKDKNCSWDASELESKHSISTGLSSQAKDNPKASFKKR